MKRLLIVSVTIGLLAASVTTAEAQVELGLSVSDGKLRSFYLAVGDHYRVPPARVVALRDRYRLDDDELPVVFFLAAQARVEPSVILDLRVGRMSWLDITFRLGLTPDILFVPVTVAHIGPPYGNAYGHYKKHGPGRDWRRIVLSDREVVDLVNLRFMSEHHGIPPERVMEMRGGGKNFQVINEDVGREKGKSQGQGKPDKDAKGQNAKGPVKKKR